ncbi:hypothetical protein K491DRAFT_756618 [Lophiostoma macrostomum CBS 122681]|uniref:Uncharacterized protein n=1 Tax=Lophiostoma macrostomum CBS 122681 TaxID=1314788 RepID=A0A6A6TGF6_9PLEO|nr:hypothetical protein K491DRAFT_756618 [Lophiostoma macrostomum CBS 122681]
MALLAHTSRTLHAAGKALNAGTITQADFQRTFIQLRDRYNAAREMFEKVKSTGRAGDRKEGREVCLPRWEVVRERVEREVGRMGVGWEGETDVGKTEVGGDREGKVGDEGVRAGGKRTYRVEEQKVAEGERGGKKRKIDDRSSPGMRVGLPQCRELSSSDEERESESDDVKEEEGDEQEGNRAVEHGEDDIPKSIQPTGVMLCQIPLTWEQKSRMWRFTLRRAWGRGSAARDSIMVSPRGTVFVV